MQIRDGENFVKFICREMDLKHGELGDKLGVSKNTIDRWATGDIPVKSRILIDLFLENHRLKKEVKEMRDVFLTMGKYILVDPSAGVTPLPRDRRKK